MTVLWAFVRRDFLSQATYRFALVETLLSILFATASYFFIGRLMEGGLGPDLPGGSYFGFVIPGLVLIPFLNASIFQVASALRQEQITGTLEAIIATPIGLSQLLLGTALGAYCLACVEACAYFGIGVALGLDVSRANWLGVFLVSICAVGSFAALGVLEAGLTLMIRRANPLSWVLSTLSALVGGAYFPPSLLPDWLRWVSALHPLSYATRGLRETLLEGRGIGDLALELAVLVALNVVLFPVSSFAFGRAVRVARSQGSLAHI